MASASQLVKTMAATAIFLLSLLAAGARMSEAAVYKVGGTIMWTSLNSPNYTAWTSGKTFFLGDTIMFVYNNQYHNVMQVSKADYTNCNTSSSLATYTTGNDSILIKSTGHLYYICGFPGHCAVGQKVDISVSASGHADAPLSPAAMPMMPPMAPPPMNPTAAAPAPKPNSASTNRIGVAYALAVVGAAAAISTLLVAS